MRSDSEFARASPKQGGACAEYLVKGQQIAITGWLSSREWTIEQGKRYGVDILASSIDFSTKPDGANLPETRVRFGPMRTGASDPLG